MVGGLISCLREIRNSGRTSKVVSVGLIFLLGLSREVIWFLSLRPHQILHVDFWHSHFFNPMIVSRLYFLFRFCKGFLAEKN